MLTVQGARLAYKHRRAFIPRPSVDAMEQRIYFKLLGKHPSSELSHQNAAA